MLLNTGQSRPTLTNIVPCRFARSVLPARQSRLSESAYGEFKSPSITGTPLSKVHPHAFACARTCTTERERVLCVRVCVRVRECVEREGVNALVQVSSSSRRAGHAHVTLHATEA